MSIYYRPITVNASPPSSPTMGEIWIKPLASTTYQGYLWLNQWCAFVSGGDYIAESNPDSHYINVIYQSALPTNIIKPGWIWINSVTLQAYLYIFDYLLLAGV